VKRKNGTNKISTKAESLWQAQWVYSYTIIDLSIKNSKTPRKDSNFHNNKKGKLSHKKMKILRLR
jgi:hypothetical protein